MKYQRFAPSGCKDIGIRRFKFVAKTQFLWLEKHNNWSHSCFKQEIGEKCKSVSRPCLTYCPTCIQIGRTFLREPMGTLRVTLAKKFHGQRWTLQLVFINSMHDIGLWFFFAKKNEEGRTRPLKLTFQGIEREKD